MFVYAKMQMVFAHIVSMYVCLCGIAVACAKYSWIEQILIGGKRKCTNIYDFTFSAHENYTRCNIHIGHDFRY